MFEFETEEFVIQEEASDIYYRLRVGDVGIYEALKRSMSEKTNSSKTWIDFKNSDAAKWLPVPPAYSNNFKSYFTPKGYDFFKAKTWPVVIQYIEPKDIVIDRVNDINNVKYRDMYQVICEKCSPVKECDTMIKQESFVMEEKLDAEARDKVKYWGLPSKKKYPLPDESHVRSALRFFKDCPEKDRPELARNIIRRACQLGMDWTKWTQLKPYLSESRQKQMVKEYNVQKAFHDTYYG